MKFRVLIEQDEDGVYVAECPSLPGCVSQGKTYREAQRNIQEAIQGYLESLHKHHDPIPPTIHETLVDVKIPA
ncbi:MAG: type II toxin-antitoxin system HicB family antitoxin [Candidatus Omnitrophica bacterium]|nr:type II toxin-antitoxin system HicB family antitoxin [Candidatus Omnitrophota bacterium]